MMWDKNPTVPKRAGHPHFDWPSDGSCHSQPLSQLSAKLAHLLAGTIYSLQLTVNSVQFTVYNKLFLIINNSVFVSTCPRFT